MLYLSGILTYFPGPAGGGGAAGGGAGGGLPLASLSRTAAMAGGRRTGAAVRAGRGSRSRLATATMTSPAGSSTENVPLSSNTTVTRLNRPSAGRNISLPPGSGAPARSTRPETLPCDVPPQPATNPRKARSTNRRRNVVRLIFCCTPLSRGLLLSPIGPDLVAIVRG